MGFKHGDIILIFIYLYILCLVLHPNVSSKACKCFKFAYQEWKNKQDKMIPIWYLGFYKIFSSILIVWNCFISWIRSSCPEVACNFIKKETLSQVFSCEFCEISRNTLSYRIPPVAASDESRRKAPDPLTWKA